MAVQTQLDRFLVKREEKRGYKPIPELETKIQEANRKFEEWRRQLLLERLKSFKPLDEETRKRFAELGWEYDEDLSALVWALIT
ncbi:MAG: hypothetical protein QW800_08860 [Candidatus Bathyarchaeia archaeon]